MKKNRCQHIEQLPSLPNENELAAYRKGARRVSAPEIHVGDSGGHPDLGYFKVIDSEEMVVEWNLAKKRRKSAAFLELCNDESFQLKRLELGWLIANIYTLNMIHDLEALGPPAGESWMEEYGRLANWYSKRSNAWRRWAVAAPGKIKT